MEDTEDCLVLDVFAPADAIQQQGHARPVVVYIHGGCGKFGSAHDPGEGGDTLARDYGLVCVHINYRLGLFGFLAHPELSSEDEEAAASGRSPGSGNYALLDQIAALQWVQRHAASFGGDPARVTLWGLSSGAQYVATLLVSPLAQGLFHRAVVQSCVDLNNLRQLEAGPDVWQGKSAEERGVEVGAALGCPRGPGQLKAMRRLSSKALMQGGFREVSTDCYESAVDRRAIPLPGGGVASTVKPLSSVEALLSGAFHRVPVMLGTTAQDGLDKAELEQTMFTKSDVVDGDGLRALFKREFGDAWRQALALYRKLARGASGYALPEAREVEIILGLLSNDLWYHAATRLMADLLASAPRAAPVFLYRFGALRRSFHGDDAAFWRGEGSTRITTAMAQYLANFAAHGDPNGAGLPHWQRHAPCDERFMVLGPQLGMDRFARSAVARFTFVAREFFLKRALEQVGCTATPSNGRRSTGPPRTRALQAWSTGLGTQKKVVLLGLGKVKVAKQPSPRNKQATCAAKRQLAATTPSARKPKSLIGTTSRGRVQRVV